MSIFVNDVQVDDDMITGTINKVFWLAIFIINDLNREYYL